MSRICIGHSNDTTDLDYLTGLLKSGVYLGMDHYALETRPGRPTWQQKTDTLRDLIVGGFHDKIMLSHDFVPLTATGTARPVRPDGPQPDGYLMVSRHVLPYLKELGVEDASIQALMVDNPRRFFGG